MRNFLALYHIVIIPIIIYLISKQSENHIFWAIFLLFVSVIISLIEWAYFKRIREKESFLRPFAHKLIVLATLLYLTYLNKFSLIILLVFILRDIIVGFIRFRASRDNIIIQGRWYGKTITISQLAIVFSVLIINFLRLDKLDIWIPLLKTVQFSLIIFAFIISLISITHYSSVYGKKIRSRKIKGKLINKEDMIILANKKSGGYKDAYRRHLLKLFARRRKAKVIYLSNSKNIFLGIEKVIKNYKHVIIAGGDGSFEGALNDPIFNNKSLGFFPLGAGNSYYSYFYKGKRFEYLRSRFSFREVPLDIIELNFNNKKVLTTFLTVGIDAEIVKQIKNVKHHNFKDYIIAGTKVMFGPKQSYNIECNVDGRIYNWKNCFNLIISKIPFFGYGFRSVIGEVDNDDGYLLGLANVNTHSQYLNKLLRFWTALLTQLGINKAPLILLKGKKFQIKSNKEIAIQIGGDFLGYTKEFSVKIKRKQKVLMI